MGTLYLVREVVWISKSSANHAYGADFVIIERHHDP
jgi:hypothetical protein